MIATFQPTPEFTMDVNRAERSWQVRWLAPLLARADGLQWFLQRIGLTVSMAEAEASVDDVYHLCFPLRDMLARELQHCRGTSALEDQLIAYYDQLVDDGLARYHERFGRAQTAVPRHAWRQSPGETISHPVAPRRGEAAAPAGLLPVLFRTESDVLILTPGHVVIVECKLETGLDAEQHERQQMVGHILAERFGRRFHFGLVTREERARPQIDVPFVRWQDIQQELHRLAVLV